MFSPDAGFGGRLAETFARFGQLCVGIDPHAWLLEEWGLPDTAAGAREFGLRVVAASHGQVGIVKPQVAFFERFGSAGFAALEDVLAAARAAGLVIIADAKRGDVGSSAEAYGEAWLTPGSPLEADAVTASAYLGVGSLDTVIALAERYSKGLYVLAATSNPEGIPLQQATLGSGVRRGQSVASGIVAEIVARNAERDHAAKDHSVKIGCLGVVLGATVDLTGYGIDTATLAGPVATSVLAPGFGHQGASFMQLCSRYGPATPVTVVSVSRSILASGPQRIAGAIGATASEVAECLA